MSFEIEVDREGLKMASGRPRGDRGKADRIYQKVVNKVESGSYYEASQIAKTLFFR